MPWLRPAGSTGKFSHVGDVFAHKVIIHRKGAKDAKLYNRCVKDGMSRSIITAQEETYLCRISKTLDPCCSGMMCSDLPQEISLRPLRLCGESVSIWSALI
jgi:hypothetical protein